jgi:hypothetical protein
MQLGQQPAVPRVTFEYLPRGQSTNDVVCSLFSLYIRGMPCNEFVPRLLKVLADLTQDSAP